MLWRHGETAYNAGRRVQGQLDVPLNATGRRQAERAARHLATLCPDAIVSSDLARAAKTAAALARLTGLSVQFDKDLRERHFGCFEGLTGPEIRERYPGWYEGWTAPDGEPRSSVADRASAALQRIADGLTPGGLAVAVGHGGSLGMGLNRLLGLGEELRVLGPFGNCSWSVAARRNGHWRLLEHNVGVPPEVLADPGADVGQ